RRSLSSTRDPAQVAATMLRRAQAPFPRERPAGRSRRSLSRPVIRVDRNIIVRQIASPHSRPRAAAAEIDAYGDFVLLHHALAVLLAIRRAAGAAINDVDVIQPE